MTIQEYIRTVGERYKSGISTEHSYRGDLQTLLSSLCPGCVVTNEPRRQKCGAPDYIITRDDIPVAYIEAKDVGISLDEVEKSEQLGRYRASLDNLILTDYLEFRLFRTGNKVLSLRIADISAGKVKARAEDLASFSSMIADVVAFKGITVTSPEKLAMLMADKARLLEEGIVRALGEHDDEEASLRDQYEAFKRVLIHDLEERQFADIYAQTIAYGLFAARLHDNTSETFTRQKARELVPRSNPFLRNLFDYVSGAQLDDRIAWIVDTLAALYRACDVEALLHDFGKTTKTTDPFIHFYETFLAKYDPKLRKSRGVYYTPEPVVSFIVRSVDAILKRDFGLEAGLADTSTTTIQVEKQGIKGKASETVHKVQILDPATGTGTFIMEVFRLISERFESQKGLWSSYVEKDLLPRVNGFEILMAPYTMAHLKLELFLRQSGYKPLNPQKPPRLRVYLTNSLEEAHPDTGTLFASWLSREATEANLVKRDAPVMVVLGNPPYANFGQMNKGEWINNLIEDYKKGLNEKKINLDDDYVKFIRYAEHFIEKNGHGIVAMITNNSYIDGMTHRRMREHLLQTFDDVYIIDLHGSVMRKDNEKSSCGDENVFDIQQGVAIVLMVKAGGKRGKRKPLKYCSVMGMREQKYNFLLSTDITSIKWEQVKPVEPYYFYSPRVLESSEQESFRVVELFGEYSSGIQTKNDELTIFDDTKSAANRYNEFQNRTIEELEQKYPKYVNDSVWTIRKARKSLLSHPMKIIPLHYRVLDYRYTLYTTGSGGFLGRPREAIAQHFVEHTNFGLIFNRQIANPAFSHVFVTNIMICHGTFYLGNLGQDYVAPLYLYPGNEELDSIQRRPNLNPKIVTDIAGLLDLRFIPDHEAPEAKTLAGHKPKGIFTPLDLLDYIYAVLHCPSYREKYKELLKIDFPRVPYPNDAESFFALAEKGARLRSLHLMEAPELQKLITAYPVSGSNNVDKIEWIGPEDEPESLGRVSINAEQYFDHVPRKAWDFWIGGYQPARKWLKDRKSRTLAAEDIFHWQRIIVALIGTGKIMEEIEAEALL
jgi:predicted helicase